jgi:hypothetical protein
MDGTPAAKVTNGAAPLISTAVAAPPRRQWQFLVVLALAVAVVVLHLLDLHDVAKGASVATAAVAALLLVFTLVRFLRVENPNSYVLRAESSGKFVRTMLLLAMLLVLTGVALVHVMVEFVLDGSADARLGWSISVAALAFVLNAFVWLLPVPTARRAPSRSPWMPPGLDSAASLMRQDSGNTVATEYEGEDDF